MQNTTEKLLESFVKASLAEKALESKMRALEEELQQAKMRTQLTYDTYQRHLKQNHS